jgi:hypothetical protein
VRRFLGIALVCLLAACSQKPNASNAPTYTKDIAPILQQQCLVCHREGEAAPFALTNYAEARDHAKAIREATATRYMPPWLPVPGHGDFEGERRLTEGQIATIDAWVAAGMPEGEASDLPTPPAFKKGWQIGEPDLILSLPEPYTLAADAVDEYRNFVIPIPAGPRYIAAMELSPGSAVTALHHAFMLIDTTRESRRRDAEDPAPGFGGMDPGTTAQSPGGHFVSWQPGKIARLAAPGFSWRLAAHTDLVLQVHLKATGKAETIAPRVGVYFTDQPPSAQPTKLVLTTNAIDVPANDAAWAFETRYRLPVSVAVMGVIPHAHYLGKKLHAFAEMPDGKSQWLLRIDDWNFNWQGDYRYAKPVVLPAGTTLVQQFTYDNSSANPRNPNKPPQRVTRGLKTTDEMGELWLQVLPRNATESETLARDFLKDFSTRRLAELEKKSAASAISVPELIELAKLYLPESRGNDAVRCLKEAILRDRFAVEAHYYLGFIKGQINDLPGAKESLEKALSLQPEHPAARNGLGMVLLTEMDFEAAADQFRQACALDPQNPIPHLNLARACIARAKREEARAALKTALELQPGNPEIPHLLEDVER